MIIDTTPKPFPFLMIRDFYDPEELNEILLELDWLTKSNVLLPAEYIGTSIDQNNLPLKQAHGIFLDQFYNSRDESFILNVSLKTQIQEIYDEMTKLSFGYESINCVNERGTLISYYENSDYYLPHRDESAFTGLTWFFKEPKSFTGGNLTFTDYDYTINIENNMFVLFPSFVRHEVDEIKMPTNSQNFSGLGRYCLSQFYYIVPTIYKEKFNIEKSI